MFDNGDKLRVQVQASTIGSEPCAHSHSGASNSLRRRLLRGVGATALSPIVTILTQLGSVPLLLHSWGGAKYGDWLLLSAIPTYMTLSDLGFGNASGSDMAMRVAANDKKGALETFQSSWVLVTSVSVLVLMLTSLFVWWIPWQPLLKLSSVTSTRAAMIVMVLGAYVIVAQQNGVAESGYRCDGHFATGQSWSTIQRLIEAAGGTLVAVLGGGLLAVACTYLVIRCVGTVCYAALLRRKSPWLSYGVRHARVNTIKKMVAPAFGFMTLPLGTALSLQGFTIVIGASLGPIAVVSFSTLRTLSRLNFQLVAVITNAVWPELSRAFGSGNISIARRLHRHICQASLGMSVSGGLVLWILGPHIYRLWIRQAIPFNATCFHILLIVVVANALWNASSVIPMSINGHCRLTTIYAGMALFSLVLAGVLTPIYGIEGSASALLATDTLMTVIALRTALRQVDDTSRSFAVALLALPRFRQALAVVPDA
jgi:O-antigen/teichoic acid export membrane protein